MVSRSFAVVGGGDLREHPFGARAFAFARGGSFWDGEIGAVVRSIRGYRALTSSCGVLCTSAAAPWSSSSLSSGSSGGTGRAPIQYPLHSPMPLMARKGCAVVGVRAP
jgi:hypothetical protein